MKRHHKTKPNPVTIAFAKENCTGVQVHCLHCQQMTIVSCDLFQDEELVMDLPKRRRFRCTKCGGVRVETRPDYPYCNDRGKWLGLTKLPITEQEWSQVYVGKT